MKDKELLDMLTDFVTNECGADELQQMTREEAVAAIAHISELLDRRLVV